MLIPDAPTVDEMESGSCVPEATYNFRIERATHVAVPKTETAKGPYINAMYRVTGPGEEFLGRCVFDILSYTGPGSFRMRSLLEATGHPTDFRLTDTDQLLGLEFSGLTIIEHDEKWGDKNRVKKYVPLVVT
jgi:hypothetical protein